MAKPKLTEITEVLLEQILELKKAVLDNEKMHYLLIRKLDELDVKVNIDELKQFEIERRRHVQDELIKVDEVYKNILEEKESCKVKVDIKYFGMYFWQVYYSLYWRLLFSTSL